MNDSKKQKLLAIENLAKNFGGIHAIKSFNLDVFSGDLIGIIGPNGAGKTALLNTITGFYRASSGKITFNETEITHHPIHKIALLGMGRTFQNIRLFKRMSVLENVMVARKNYFENPIQYFFNRAQHLEQLDQSMDCLSMLKLADKANQSAASLSYGDARRLEIARALAGVPKILLLDEPAAGMNETETKQLIEDIQIIRSKVDSIVLIEHDMNLIRTLSDRVVAMDFGQKICEGSAQDVLSHPEVMSAYLGVDEGEGNLS